MATSIVSRLAPVTARDGVNTRKQANWARVAAQPRKTICRSDTIIGLEQLVAKQSLEGLQWGDIMTNNLRDYSSDAVIVYRETTNYDVWEDLADEPWKYGNDVFEWIDLDKKLANSPRVAAYWVFRAKLQEDKRVEVQRAWHEKMKPIAQSIGVWKLIEPPHIVAIHENILMPVGTAMIMVAAVKYILVFTSRPAVNM